MPTGIHANWEPTHSRGPARFILLRGVLGWGVPTAILFTIVMMFVQPNYHLWPGLAINLVLFPVGGFFWGRLMWNRGERRYRETHPTG